MKKIILLSSILAASLFIVKPASAQFHASINIGVQPEWGPAGYDYAEYYYLPDVEAYYCVPTRQFVYEDGNNWVYASSLPRRCGNYDLYSGYKVVLNERNPWSHFENHRAMYSPYRYRRDQIVLRDYRRGGYDRGFEQRGWDRNREWRNNGRWSRDDDRRDDFRRHDNGRWHNEDRRNRW